MIREVVHQTPFAGEGHRKITARLRREREVGVGRKRVLRLMRLAGLLAPQRARGRRKPRPHDGTIIPGAPDLLWGTDTAGDLCARHAGGGSVIREAKNLSRKPGSVQ